MSMTIDVVIGWKHNHQPGMCCKMVDDAMTIVEFPGGIPTQEDQDAWTAEHDAWIASGGEKEAEADKMGNLKKAIIAKATVDYAAIAELRTAYNTLPKYLKAIRDEYRDSL